MSRKRKQQILDARNFAVVNLPLQAADAPPADLRVCCGERVEFDMQADAGGGVKAKKFSMVAYTGEPMYPSGWYQAAPIVVDLAGMDLPRQTVPVDVEHKAGDIAGHTTAIEKSAQRLKASGLLSGFDESADDASAKSARMVARLAAGGFPWQASMDFTANMKRLEFVDAGASVNVNGKRVNGPVYIARASTLKRISFVANGADGNTGASIAASQKQGEPMNPFEQWLQAKGIDVATLADPAKIALKASYDAEQAAKNKPQDPPPPVAKADDPTIVMRAAAVAESTRISEIMAICAKAGNPEIDVAGVKVSLQSHAIGSGMSADKVKLQAQEIQLAELQASRANAPTIFMTAGAPTLNNEHIEAALCLRAGLPGIEKRFSAETLGIVDKHYKDLGIQQVLLWAAAQNGMSVRPGDRITSNGRLREVMRHAFAPQLGMQASSTFSLPNVLGAVAYKELLQGYMEEDQNWRLIAKIRPVNNFYQRTFMRLLDNMVYEQLGPNGEIKHGSLSEETYTAQAKTYAKMFALTREAMINDDLGAFDDIRTRLGRGAAQKFNQVFWTAFINNSSFFTTARTNYISGATTNLGTDGVGLGLAVKQVRKMTSPTADGTKHVGAGVVPKICLVPPELEQIAEQNFRNQNLGAGTTVGNANIYANKYEPVVVWQLSDSSYTGYSTTAWYLLADPNVAAPMMVSFLNGQQVPTVESADADFDTLGVQFRGYHDFGCDQADYLCGVKSKGAA